MKRNFMDIIRMGRKMDLVHYMKIQKLQMEFGKIIF